MSEQVQVNEAGNSPEGDARGAPDPGDRGRGRSRQRVRIPGVDEILGKLIQLNGAVALGAMSSKDANLIQKNLKTVLDVQLKRANREDTGPSQEALLELCRDDPRLLNVIEPFLTDAQMDWLMQEVTDDQHESA